MLDQVNFSTFGEFMRVKPLDILLFVALLAWSIYVTVHSVSSSGDRIMVHAADDVYEFSLKDDGIHKVKGPLGETTIEVKGGRVHIIDSPCKNKTCIRQGFAKPLVCLPNKIIVDIEESEGFDAIAE